MSRGRARSNSAEALSTARGMQLLLYNTVGG